MGGYVLHDRASSQADDCLSLMVAKLFARYVQVARLNLWLRDRPIRSHALKLTVTKNVEIASHNLELLLLLDVDRRLFANLLAALQLEASARAALCIVGDGILDLEASVIAIHRDLLGLFADLHAALKLVAAIRTALHVVVRRVR